MPKIKKLSPHEAQKIAAGEVVERPANVVKELIENALDAAATTITVYIEDGGKKVIRVVDNGCGMAEDDARLCFEHHATSKISGIADLDTITTFGFRGEALSSIASVSAVTLVTKEHNNVTGIKIKIEGGILQTIEESSALSGTDITVRDLFFNVPARKKFLKKRETELNHIQQLFNAFCLSHRAIHFKLYNDGKLLYNCPPADTHLKRIAQLWDESVVKHMIPLECSEASTIVGAISDHQFFRYDRSSIYCFVNNRWVKNHQLGTALVKGYHAIFSPGRYPAAVLFITVDQRELDINTHPRKEEVQFLHPQRITMQLQEQVRTTLEQLVSKHIQKNVTLMPPIDREIVPQTRSMPTYYAPTPTISSWQPIVNTAAHVSVQQPHRQLVPLSQQQMASGAKQATIGELTEAVLIGQLHKTYILLEHETGLLMIDQHAAHERILYEHYTHMAASATVQLLFPQCITLSVTDMQTILPHLDVLHQCGIEVEQFGHDQLIIQSTPVHAKSVDLTELIKEFIGWLIEEKDRDYTKINHQLYAHMACKAAVKAGDVLTQEHMQKLVNDLRETNNRFSCPHGRPTIWIMRLDDIEKKFKRDYRG